MLDVKIMPIETRYRECPGRKIPYELKGKSMRGVAGGDVLYLGGKKNEDLRNTRRTATWHVSQPREPVTPPHMRSRDLPI